MKIISKKKISVIIIIAGIIVLLFPTVENFITTEEMQHVITEVFEKADDIKKSNEDNTLDIIYNLMKQYNQNLRENGQQVDDGFTYEQTSFDLTKYRI